MVSGAGWKSQLWLFPLMVLPPLLAGQAPPFPNLDLGNLPDTAFSCEGKVVGGYYADIETECQMFHVCTLGSKGETQDIKFLCIQDTVFNQKTRVCERSEEVVCKDAREYYDLNKELYQTNSKPHSEPPPPEEEEVTDSAVEASVATSVLFKVNSADYREPAGGPFSNGNHSRRPTQTRPDVPLFNPRRSESRTSPPSTQAFSWVRQERKVNLSAPPPSPSPRPQPTTRVSVPLIPTSNELDRPRVVVTNGKPFVPKLDAPDPAPAKKPKEEDFPSLTLPDTNFSCEAKVSGGHYADPETNCRMFHICVMGPGESITDYKFLCGSGTAFEQKSLTCQEIEKIDCSSSAENYHVNNHLIVPKTVTETTTFEPARTESSPEYSDDYYYYFDDYAEYPDYTDSSTSKSQLTGTSSTTYRSTF